MSGYIMNLRKIVGHRTLLQVGASVILENTDGRILLQKRKDNDCWAYHGGSVETDEDTESAAARELFEETGLVAEELELLGVFSGPGMHYVYPNGDEVSNVDIVYLCRKFHGNICPQEEEVTELRYFDPMQLPDHLFTANVPALEAYQKLLKDVGEHDA